MRISLANDDAVPRKSLAFHEIDCAPIPARRLGTSTRRRRDKRLRASTTNRRRHAYLRRHLLRSQDLSRQGSSFPLTKRKRPRGGHGTRQARLQEWTDGWSSGHGIWKIACCGSGLKEKESAGRVCSVDCPAGAYSSPRWDY